MKNIQPKKYYNYYVELPKNISLSEVADNNTDENIYFNLIQIRRCVDELIIFYPMQKDKYGEHYIYGEDDGEPIIVTMPLEDYYKTAFSANNYPPKLENNMVVKLRNGYKYIYKNNEFIFVDNEWISGTNLISLIPLITDKIEYDENLININQNRESMSHLLDVMNIYTLDDITYGVTNRLSILDDSNLHLLWQRYSDKMKIEIEN